jgi:hypothetical protein
MNPFSCIINLFEHEPEIIDININKDCSSMEEREERHNRLVQAVDLFLKEIELKVENIDFNNDKHQIKLLLQKFEDIDKELVLIHRSYERLKGMFENDKVLIKKRTSSKLCRMNKKGRETYLFSLQIKNIISKKKIEINELNHEIEKCKKFLKLISEIQERKRKVEKKLKELGIKCK